VKRIAVWTLAFTLVFGLVGPGMAQAAVKQINVRVTLKVSATNVQQGQRVTFSGVVKSPNRKRCMANRVVKVTRNGKHFGRATTGPRGRYSFTKRVRFQGRYRAVVRPFRFGTHPNRKICKLATSKRILIRVR
jgi:hypothetical protein